MGNFGFHLYKPPERISAILDQRKCPIFTFSEDGEFSTTSIN
jgi:hypothetical protein